MKWAGLNMEKSIHYFYILLCALLGLFISSNILFLLLRLKTDISKQEISIATPEDETNHIDRTHKDRRKRQDEGLGDEGGEEDAFGGDEGEEPAGEAESGGDAEAATTVAPTVAATTKPAAAATTVAATTAAVQVATAPQQTTQPTTVAVVATTVAATTPAPTTTTTIEITTTVPSEKQVTSVIETTKPAEVAKVATTTAAAVTETVTQPSTAAPTTAPTPAAPTAVQTAPPAAETTTAVVTLRPAEQSTPSTSIVQTLSQATNMQPTATQDKSNQTLAYIVPGYVCSTKLLRKVDLCCPTPSLITQVDVELCLTPGRKKRQLIKQIANMLFPQRNKKKQQNQQKKKQQNINPFPPPTWHQEFQGSGASANLPQICLVDCVFRHARWMSENDVLNWDILFSSITFNFPNWKAHFDIAKQNCERLLYDADANMAVRDSSGRLCFELPTKIVRCIKRELALVENALM